LDALGKVAGEMRNPVLLGNLGGGVLVAAHQRRHLDALNALERIEMLLAEGALPGNANLHRHLLLRTEVFTRAAARFSLVAGGLLLPAARFFGSRMMCPTAVLEAGTV